LPTPDGGKVGGSATVGTDTEVVILVAILRVTATVVWEIDTDAYLAVAEESEALADGQAEQMRADDAYLADVATGYADADDHLPRWARDTMRVVSATATTERIDR